MLSHSPATLHNPPRWKDGPPPHPAVLSVPRLKLPTGSSRTEANALNSWNRGFSMENRRRRSLLEVINNEPDDRNRSEQKYKDTGCCPPFELGSYHQRN